MKLQFILAFLPFCAVSLELFLVVFPVFGKREFSLDLENLENVLDLGNVQSVIL